MYSINIMQQKCAKNWFNKEYISKLTIKNIEKNYRNKTNLNNYSIKLKKLKSFEDYEGDLLDIQEKSMAFRTNIKTEKYF